MARIISTSDWDNHKFSIINQIEDILDEGQYDFESEMKAFNLLVARLIASSALDEHLTISDGNYDQGIDFYVEYNNRLEVFQCKFAEFQTIENSNKPISFNDDGVLDINNAYNYLTKKETQIKANSDVSSIKAKLQLSNFDSVDYYLVVFGKLTDDACSKFADIQNTLQSDSTKFKLIEWNDIVEELILQTTVPKQIKSILNIHDQQVLTKKDYCYAIVNVIDFYKAFDNYGWSIFDLNVRSELHNSPVNSDIVASLTHMKDMKNFHHLNNGILIFCDSYSLKPKDSPSKIEISNYQIINGCQTVRSIYNAYRKIISDASKLDVFENNCFVQVKIISKNSQTSSLMDKVIISSNNQNPMNERNLKSNTAEQKQIKSLFENLSGNKWFYQRKDGEFKSLRKLPKVGSFIFKVSLFKGENNTYRCIDNKDLAKAWLSFIGLSYYSIMNSDYFKNDKLYELVFKSKPNHKLEEAFLKNSLITLGVNFTNRNTYFSFDVRPSAEEYLLSYLLWLFIKGYSTKSRENRRLALERAVSKGELKADQEGKIISPQEEQANYLISDSDYMVNNIIDNAKEVFLETFSFVLAKKYGTGQQIAKKLINSASFTELNKSPKVILDNIDRSHDNILFSTYEFIRYCLKQLYFEIKSDYIAAPRRKTYLASQDFVKKLKDKVNESIDSGLSEYNQNWKKLGVEFINSLPEIK